MKEKIKEFEEKMEGLRKLALERISAGVLKKSPTGKFLAIIYFLVGLGSIFLYWLIFNLNIIVSIILGIITWFGITFIVDKIFIKSFRIDKQLDWLLKTPEGLAEMKKKGITDEQIEQLKKDVENYPLSKKFTLDKNK